MEDGVSTSSTTKGTGLLHPYLISAASLAPLIVMAGRATGSAVGGKIHAANCAKHSAIQPLTTLNSSIEAMDNNLVQIWRCIIFPQQVLPIGFQTPVKINTLHLTLHVWLPQNHISIMIICMLVMVRDSPYIISVIQKYIHLIVLSLCLVFFMFLQSGNICFLFKNFVLITIFILNFTLLYFMSRISTPIKSISQVKVKMVFMLCLSPFCILCQGSQHQ